jgi:hypothetical protein
LQKITWIQPYYDLILSRIPTDAKTILDVGAGYGINGFIMKRSRDAIVEAIEPFPYNIDHYDFIYRMTWKEYVETEKYKKKFDVIVSTEAIEHMSEQDGLSFLVQARELARKVIVATPYDFEKQEAYDGNDYQLHRSHWSIEDFGIPGYKCHILGTFHMKGLTARIHFHPKWLKVLKLFGVKPTNIIAEWGE